MGRFNTKIMNRLCEKDEKLEKMRTSYHDLLENRSKELKNTAKVYRNRIQETDKRKDRSDPKTISAMGTLQNIKQQFLERQKSNTKLEYKKGLLKVKKQL